MVCGRKIGLAGENNFLFSDERDIALPIKNFSSFYKQIMQRNE
jgi:hypothetical protein